jgi:CTD small phosphatase-like protein 2
LLGRDLKKIIIIDNIAENFKNQPDNGIFIQTWCGDDNDRILEELTPLLSSKIVNRNCRKESG